MVRFHTGGAIGVECEWWSLGYFFTLPQKGWDWEGGEENGVLIVPPLCKGAGNDAQLARSWR